MLTYMLTYMMTYADILTRDRRTGGLKQKQTLPK